MSVNMASYCPMVLLIVLLVVVNCAWGAAYPKAAEDEGGVDSAESDNVHTTATSRKLMTCVAGPTLYIN